MIGEKWCIGHKRFEDPIEFGKGRNQCRKYEAEKSRERRKILRNRDDSEIITPKEKYCPDCKKTKNSNEFGKNKNHKDGLHSICKECVNKKNKKRYKILRNRDDSEIITPKEKYCPDCKKTKNSNEFYKNKNYKDGLHSICKECVNKRSIERYENNKIDYSMSSGIYRSLKGNKNGRHWESLVDYTLDDLIDWLEFQFEPGMTWDNYGEWHIDHYIPKSYFKFETTDDIDFKICWALKNLRPMWGSENIAKSNILPDDYKEFIEEIKMGINL